MNKSTEAQGSGSIEELVVLGPPGSYLDGLATSMNVDCPVIYGVDFPDVIQQITTCPERAGLIVINNTLNGPLHPNVGAFQGGELRVEQAAKLDVVSSIMGLGTLEEARTIAGKDVALKQITGFMPHLARRVMASTSAAGKLIQDTGDRTLLSVGSSAQAEIYGLNVLAKDVQDPVGLNRTTVLLVRARESWVFDPGTVEVNTDLSGTMILNVTDTDKPGSLHRALGELAERNINLTSLESLTIRGTEYSEFFITFAGTGKALVDLLTSKQAARHMNLDVLGVYEEPVVYGS
ncbi:ACT domain-containing protein [Candidatus Saccharibacteria bacterium]|nr:ACT domain-containing protein [Candidatus Saccharibacteria bacterium]